MDLSHHCQPDLYIMTFQIADHPIRHTQPETAHCNPLQLTADHWTPLQTTGPYCNPLHPTAAHCRPLDPTADHWTPLQPTAAHCRPLDPTATHCNPLQTTGPHCGPPECSPPECSQPPVKSERSLPCIPVKSHVLPGWLTDVNAFQSLSPTGFSRVPFGTDPTLVWTIELETVEWTFLLIVTLCSV